MRVYFFEPSHAQKTGGLELAIRSIEGFLKRAGVTVRCNPSVACLEGAEAPDIVHFHGLWQPKFLRISALCRRLRIPYVVSPHGMLEPWAWRHKRWKKWPWYHLFERAHISRASRLLTTSEAEARNLRNLLPSTNCHALPLGITTECRPDYAAARRTLGWSESEAVLLFLSRVHPKKGLSLLLLALAGLESKSVRHLRLVVVGDGEARYLRELKEFAQQRANRLPPVDWVGGIWGDRKWVYFQGADLFCLPSYSENFGLAVLEALQVGTRVLTTDRTPWDMVPSWGAGMIVRPDERALRSALAEFLANLEWTNDQRAALASRIHRQFSWDAVGPAYLRFYEHMVEEQHKKAR
jgi:glycosyltransferase involved in cell wall biosynthesis